jgi:uncharacterized SAM-binding protein YcdF (DUF218 family)
MMSTVLQNDFRVPVRWREDRAANIYQNAAFSAEMLRQAGVPSALLVTHPWHMARALWSFRAVGYPVVPAGLHTGEAITLSVSSFFPQNPSTARQLLRAPRTLRLWLVSVPLRLLVSSTKKISM